MSETQNIAGAPVIVTPATDTAAGQQVAVDMNASQAAVNAAILKQLAELNNRNAANPPATTQHPVPVQVVKAEEPKSLDVDIANATLDQVLPLPAGALTDAGKEFFARNLEREGAYAAAEQLRTGKYEQIGTFGKVAHSMSRGVTRWEMYGVMVLVIVVAGVAREYVLRNDDNSWKLGLFKSDAVKEANKVAAAKFAAAMRRAA